MLRNVIRNHRLWKMSLPSAASTLRHSFTRHNSTHEGAHAYEENIHTNSSSNNSTYVEEEVAKFRAMANSWWDIHGDCKPLHSLNRLRVALVREGLIQSGLADPSRVAGPVPLTGLNILDVGCGGGIMCEPLARLGATVTGLDAAKENVVVAELHASVDRRIADKITYVEGTIEDHAAGAEKLYDAVIASEVLEHIDNVQLFLDTCSSLIKPGGSLFLTTINKTQTSWLGAVVVAEYLMHLLPIGTHDWNKFIPLQDLHYMLESSGLDVQLVHGLLYNPIANRWHWTSNTCINYAVHAIKQV
ncbi:ubiquinone biosynthesis O-methyltransferase, mitochondrial-like [Oratosquilla oratoria]|uniref:ubiquinone biosynthesis O-methyltransferase, mitochondrial-like n=1 Tax=Oratosquilla oratoria TaxID=337810 RepID=UPI003F7572BD